MSKLNFSSLLALPVILFLSVLLISCDPTPPVECDHKATVGASLNKTYTVTGVTAIGDAGGATTGAAAVWNATAATGSLTITLAATAGDSDPNCGYSGSFTVAGRPSATGVDAKYIDAVLPASGTYTTSNVTGTNATVTVGGKSYTLTVSGTSTTVTLVVTVAAVTSASNRENVVAGTWTFTLAPK